MGGGNLEDGGVRQVVESLDYALAVGLLADEIALLIILEGASGNLRGRGSGAINEDDGRVIFQRGLAFVGIGIGIIALGRFLSDDLLPVNPERK